MYELGSDFFDLPTSGDQEKSNIFDESGFDNEHSIIKTPKKSSKL